jgi:transcription initiation factor TFIID subunit TAF12
MKKKTSQNDQISQEERLLIERLRGRPEMMARVQSILEIARNEGELKTAGEVEDLLIQEMRKLGNTTMRDWAGAAQERVSEDLRVQEPGLRSRKKKR